MSFSRQRVLLQTLCLLVGILCLNTSQAVVIDLPGLGQINGTTTQSHWTGRTIYQYRGIPFAEPPVGDLRFKVYFAYGRYRFVRQVEGPMSILMITERPVKYSTAWDGVRDCNDFGPICPQGYSILGYMNAPENRADAEQSEDCLTINVYSNKLSDGGVGTGLAVMVYIHGGAFVGGSATSFDPLYLLEKDVLLVVPQYRLGPLGFLSLKTEDMPGNQGMLDVVLALEWVRDNIEHFGGDPSRVTVFGQSAGGAAVTSLLFSPLVDDGLIQRMIAHSGSVLGTWVTDPDPVAHGKAIAALALCVQTNDAALANCLRNKSVKTIMEAHNRYLTLDALAGGRFVGGHHLVWDEAGANSFMLSNPVELFEKGNYRKLPMMAGVTKHEGSWFFGIGYDYLFKPFNLTEDPHYLSWKVTRRALEYGGIEDSTGYTAGFIRDQYFTADERGNFTAMTPGLIDILGVAFLKASTFILATEMSLSEDTYFYSFNYWGEHSFNSDPSRPYEDGISHSHELPFLFNFGRTLNDKDDAMAQQMVEIWTNYAINGVPKAEGIPEWPPMSTADGPYLKFDSVHKIYDNFVDEEYTIAVKEGLTDSNQR